MKRTAAAILAAALLPLGHGRGRRKGDCRGSAIGVLMGGAALATDAYVIGWCRNHGRDDCAEIEIRALLDAQEQVKRLYNVFGPQRLMWATDWPACEAHTTYAKALTLVRSDMKFLSAEDKSWMLSRTIEQVWPFSA